jgi:serine protease
VIQQSVSVALALLTATVPALARPVVRGGGGVVPLRWPMPSAGGEELIISYHSRCTAADKDGVEKACGAVACREAYDGAFHVLTLPRGRAAQQMAARLRSDPRVRLIEPNGRVRALTTPTDPYFSSYQWDMSDTGFGIHVPSAWDRSTGLGTTVAVVDTGIAYESYNGFLPVPELAQTRFAPGWDFVNNDAHPNDDNGHGTHVAGIIAAGANNGLGVAGVAPDARLMPVKVLSADGTGPTSTLAEGIRYAADHGAQVINVSLGTSQSSDALKEAVQYALGKGAVIVAAAGNDGNTTPMYPAAYPGVISVGATRFDGQRAYYSSYGPTLTVVAPGGDPNVDQNGDGFPDGILEQTFSRDRPTQFGFYFKAGTSQAAPHVSGVAALVLSVHPDLTPDQVEEAITHSATDLGPLGRDDQYGYGLVNAAAAVNYVPGVPLLNAAMDDPRVDNSPFNFEGGGFQGWNTTDVSRASLLNTNQFAYRGQHSLQVSLKGISDFTPGIIRVAPDGGVNIPAGHSVTAYVQATSPAGVAARVVLYDSRGIPVVGSFVTLTPGRWTPVSVSVPTWANGPFRWIFMHFRTTGFSYTGTCYVDSVGW